MTPVLPYVDPSVMSYAVQAIAGVAIACGVVFGVIWRKVKRNAQKVLKIDENTGKEVEADIQIVDAGDTSVPKDDANR